MTKPATITKHGMKFTPSKEGEIVNTVLNDDSVICDGCLEDQGGFEETERGVPFCLTTTPCDNCGHGYSDVEHGIVTVFSPEMIKAWNIGQLPIAIH